VNATIEEGSIVVEGLTARYFVAGAGPALVLLHGDGDSKFSWTWVLPALARTYRVYALDLPGFGDVQLSDYRPEFFVRFVAGFLDALDIPRAAVIGNSFGGLVALRLALAAPARVSALGLVDSAGLGVAMTPMATSLSFPGYGEAALGWGRTPFGAAQRNWLRDTLLFARPGRVPAAWYAEQERLARRPGFGAATLAALRAIVGPGGQRDVLLWQLPRLTIPTLVLWGANDMVFPAWQAYAANASLRRGRLTVLPDCGHLPHVERPAETVAAITDFLLRAERHDKPRATPVPTLGG
jgi:4,5:9,10-diseco-3-hydroxy-5,9,17-trioxoandrosta-1(10),2-diene-4-oate hydrolase